MKFGISIISAMGLVRQIPQSLIDKARGWGFDGVQMLPIRRATGLETDVLLFENAWNAVPSFWHAFRHLDGASGDPSTLLDWYFFPPHEECELITEQLSNQGIPEIGHDFDETPLVELKPGIGSADQIVAGCQRTGNRLVFDPRHFCRSARRGKEEEANRGPSSPFGSHLGWQLKSLQSLAPHIKVIHYQPIDGENLSDLFKETDNNTTRTLVRKWA